MLVKEDFNCCHAELPTETSTDLLNADSVHYRSLNDLFQFLIILTLSGAYNQRFMNVYYFECDLVIISMSLVCFLATQHAVVN